VAVAVLSLGVVLALGSGGKSGGPRGSRLELDVLDTQVPEPLVRGLSKDLVVTFPAAELRAVQTLPGSVRFLSLSCDDLTGKRVVHGRLRLPLSTDGGAYPSHGHLYLTEDRAIRVARCTVTGPGIGPFHGKL
jgi:hypothetical protein